MKEKIYTIRVTDAFREECECPLCVLEKKLEDEYVDYVLGPSMMEPDGRAETNEKGFCRMHFEMLYNKQQNRLGLGLILDTHLVELNKNLRKIFKGQADAIKKDGDLSLLKNLSNKLTLKQTDTEKLIDRAVAELTKIEDKCTICSKLDYTMDRYVDVLFYLWSRESEFRKLFLDKKGFCLKHFKQLLEGIKKYLSSKDRTEFTNLLVSMQLEHMDRIQQEINWFTKKFDYRYNDAPWGNSKDAVPRSIQKIAGHSELK